MSLLDDARRIAATDWSEGDICRYCEMYSHLDTCLWFAIPKIVAALEAAERVVRDKMYFDCGYANCRRDVDEGCARHLLMWAFDLDDDEVPDP